MFILLGEHYFFWKFIFLGCLSGWLLISLIIMSNFVLLSFKILAQACELDSPFIVSWKPRPNLMEGDLWILRRLSKILVLSWNLKCLSFSSNLIFIMFTSTSILWYYSFFSRYLFPIPSSTFLLSSNSSFNSIISSFNPFSCSSNTWSSSLVHLFEFSRSDLRETISASSPSQYCLDSTVVFTDLTWYLLSYAYNLSLRLLILFKAKSTFILRLIISSNLSSSKVVTPSDITYSPT